MKKASLFSGIGGIDLAAHWAGMETVVFCEREPFPQRVLRKHWPHVPIIDDVRNVTREELEKRGVLGNGRTIDIISAGYPCQPFSYAGKRRGAEDDRHLWPEVKRILEEIRPRWFVGENVAGHVSLGLDDVLADLGGAGYAAQAFLIPAAAVRASHRRDRVFIVAYSGSGKCQSGTEVKGILRGMQANGTIGNYAGGRSAAQSGEIVADTTRERCGEAREHIDGSAERVAGRSETVAHTNDERREECHTPAISEGLGQRSRGNHAGRAYGARRTIEPGVGGGADEFSAEMDGGRLNAYSSGVPETSATSNSIDQMRGMRVDRETSKTSLQRIGELPRREDSLSEMPHESGYKVGEMGSRATQNQNMRDMSFGIHQLQPQQCFYMQPEMLVGVGTTKCAETMAWIEGRGMNPLDALADFVANYPQPALMGQPQYEWEPSRVATGVKNRVARLKALGNAVDPLQIFPIMYAIKLIDDYLQSGQLEF